MVAMKRIVILVLVILAVSVALEATASTGSTQADPPSTTTIVPSDGGGSERAAIAAVIDAAAQQEIDRQVAEYLAAVEAQRVADEAARQSSVRRFSTPTVATECGNTVLPDHIVMRESRGDCDAFNADGCNGRGCIGYAQLDQGHFSPVSPWNPDVPGTCYGLTYNECVEKLYGNGDSTHW